MLTEQFIDTMMGYLEYVPMILELTPMVSNNMVASALSAFLDQRSVSCEADGLRKIYKLGVDDWPAYRRFNDSLSAAASTTRALPRLLTVGIVTSLEYHIGVLMKAIALLAPDTVVAGDTKVALNWAMTFSSMDELKDAVINDEIDRVQRQNVDEQIGWVISKVPGMDDIRPKYPGWANIIELFERRNLFIHANGIVNKHYLKALQKFNPSNGKDAKIGDELHAHSRYYSESVRTVFHFGVMLSQVIWRKLAPEESAIADKSISDLGYELLARGQYKLAIRILEFARSLRDVSEDRTRMNVVNLANAHKLRKDEAEALKVLESMDWTAVGPKFKISIAAVRGDVDEVVRLMHRLGTNDEDVTAFAYQNWPVFYHVREDNRFKSAFKSIFNADFDPCARKQAGIAQVLQWSENGQQAIALNAETEPKQLH